MFSVHVDSMFVIEGVIDERAVAALFARQEGLATTTQLGLHGATRSAVRHRLRTGEWTRISETVIANSATPWTWTRRVRAAWLDAGEATAVSHTTAGRAQRFDGFDNFADIHLTAFEGWHRTSLPGVTVHRSRLLRAKDCATWNGMRIVSRPLALVQLAPTLPADRIGQALDGMLRDGDRPRWIESVARDWLARGSTGAATVLTLLHERVDCRLSRSWYQRLAKRVLDTRALMFVDEYPVFDPITGKQLAALDLALPDLMIGVECQSWEWHGSPSAQARDDRRKRRLRVLGWEIAEVWWTDLRRMDEVLEELQYLIDRRRSGSMP